MPGRVLNFNEFSDKYSNQNGELGLDAVIQSPSNFEDGFDDSTYDQQPIGPNRPVSGGYDATPNQPSGEFAPDFTDDSMNAPEETEEVEETPEETEETPEENTEDESEENEEESEENDEDEEDNEEKETEDIPEPEAGANPSNESLVLSFNQFINESEWIDDLYNEEESEHDHEDYFDDSTCTECGEEIWYTDQGANCGCNM